MKRILIVVTVCVFTIISCKAQQNRYIKYNVSQGETIATIAKKFSITPFDILRLNPTVKGKNLENLVLILPNKIFQQQTATEALNILQGNYIYHKILPKETWFSLSKFAGMSKRKLKKLNPNLKRGLIIGEFLKVKAKRALVTALKNQNHLTKTIDYTVLENESQYTIAKKYNITVALLNVLNNYKKITTGVTIRIPYIENEVTKNIAEKPKYLTHIVSDSDSYLNITQQYKVSVSELFKLNPVLQGGLKPGLALKIPIVDLNELAEPASINYLIDSVSTNRTINALLLLPFKADNDSIPFDNVSTDSKLLNIATDFYLGATMALDSLKNKGLSVNLQVYDTKNSLQTIDSLEQLAPFKNADIIIGPLFAKNINHLLYGLHNEKTIVISPLSNKAELPYFSKTKLFQERPNQEQLTQKMVAYIIRHHTDQKLIIVTDNKPGSNVRLTKVIDQLKENASIDSISVIQPVDGYIKKENFIENIDTITTGVKNWVLLLSTDGVTTADVVNNLSVMPKEAYDITLFGINKGKNYTDIDNNALARLNFYYVTDEYLDYKKQSIQNFVEAYRKRYYTDPSLFAFKGFDCTYDALMRVANVENLDLNLSNRISERTILKYDYRNNKGNKFVNNGLYLIKYDGLNLKLLKD